MLVNVKIDSRLLLLLLLLLFYIFIQIYKM